METFSCRNCVQNPMQGMTVGGGQGYCLHWSSVIREPHRTTCKYLHRKDLPHYLVDEGRSAHAAEFAHAAGPADLMTLRQIPRVKYSERAAWDGRSFDPALHAVAMYHRGEGQSDVGGKSRFIQAFVGSMDGQRAMAYSSLVRRYMHHCDSWTSSYRLLLAQISEIDTDVVISRAQLVADGAPIGEVAVAAKWEVFFCRVSAIQEFGWHASMDTLVHPLVSVRESVISMDWDALMRGLSALKDKWQDEIIEKAKVEGEYFPPPAAYSDQ